MVADGEFREDLFYRVNVVHLAMPPLRARAGDVLVLAQYFIEHFARICGRDVVGLSVAAAARIRDYDWPGNVRELRNAIERAVAVAGDPRVTVEDLPERIRAYRPAPAAAPPAEPDPTLALEEVERRHILRVLEAQRGNKLATAQVLGIDRKTLYRKLERYGLEREL
jgi:two-component system response regulator HydG